VSDALRPKQQVFVDEYLKDLNASAAARRAGYSEKSVDALASQLMSIPKVAAAIKAALEEREARTKVSQDWVIKKLVKIVERSMQEEPVLDKQGNSTGEYTFNAFGANKALELLGRHLGMWKDRVEVAGRDGAPIKITVAELAQLAKGDSNG